MADNLFAPPDKYALPLSKGQDLVVDFQQVDTADPPNFVNFDDGQTVTLYIDAATPISATATVSTYHALVQVDYSLTDTVKNNALWRLVLATPGGADTDDFTETVLINGTVARFDGRS